MGAYTATSWDGTAGCSNAMPDIGLSKPAFRIEGAYSSVQKSADGASWVFSIKIYLHSFYKIEVSNFGSSKFYVDLYTNPDRVNGHIGSGSGNISGSMWVEGEAIRYNGEVSIPNIKGVAQTIYCKIHADLRGMVGSCGNPGLHWNYYSNNYGHTDITDLYEYGQFDVSDIQLSPNITSFKWRSGEIYEDGLSMEYTADQNISQCRVRITNLDTGEKSGDIYPGQTNIDSSKHQKFLVTKSHWDKIDYAYHYNVELWVKNTSNQWNENSKTKKCDANTGNHKPILTGTNIPHLDWYDVYWNADIPVDINSNYPKSTDGISYIAYMNASTPKGQFRYVEINPGSNINFKLMVLSRRRIEDTSSIKYGTYKSDELNFNINLLKVASIVETLDFIFGNPFTYHIYNNSERCCIVEMYSRGELILRRGYDKELCDGYKPEKAIQSELDKLYKTFKEDSNEVDILYKVITLGEYGVYETFNSCVCRINGNVLSSWIGNDGTVKRCKDFIGINKDGVPKRCIAWIGDKNKIPRRCI